LSLKEAEVVEQDEAKEGLARRCEEEVVGRQPPELELIHDLGHEAVELEVRQHVGHPHQHGRPAREEHQALGHRRISFPSLKNKY
jgi:hypothetical protein